MDNGICPECGAQNMPENTYCANRGAHINTGETPPENVSSSVLIDGNPVNSVAEFVGKNSKKIIPKLLRMEQKNSKISWCWPPFLLGFFFGPIGIMFWFLYRKMYKPACFFGAIGALIIFARLAFPAFLVADSAIDSYNGVHENAQYGIPTDRNMILSVLNGIFNVFADLSAKTLVIALLPLLLIVLRASVFLCGRLDLTFLLYTKKLGYLDIFNAFFFTKSFICFVFSILIGLFGLYIYKKHIANCLGKRPALLNDANGSDSSSPSPDKAQPANVASPPDLIDGNPVNTVAGFVDKNRNRIIPELLRMEQKGSKISWCWSPFLLGLLFGPLGVMIWFLYRKMYKHACLFGAIGALITGVRLAIGMYEEAVSSFGLDSVAYEFAALTASFFALFLGPDALGSIVHIDSINDVNNYTTFFKVINHTAVLLDFACAILIGLFGMYIYKRHIAKRINNKSPLSNCQNTSTVCFDPHRGTSVSNVIAGIFIVCMAILIISMITSDILGRPELEVTFSDGSVKRYIVNIGYYNQIGG
ncbi:MAG: hypothetical protein IKZ47_07010 [Clostridia bacterium]|nr:hypothetical protein [Clostridia bacterium]